MSAPRNGRWLMLAAAAWLALTAGLWPLALPDEGRYVGVAWEMLRSGDWLVPTLDGLPYFHKPPLFYWLTAGSMSVFGTGELALRAAPLLGALLGMASVYGLLRRWVDERVARWAVVCLATQPLWFGGAQYANLDMLVAGCITATIALAAHSALCLDNAVPGHRRALVGAYAMAALGVLAKGLIGLLLPAIVVLAWLVIVKRSSLLPRLLSAPGIAAFSAIALPWFFAMESRYDGFLHYFFVLHHFQRFTSGGFNNQEPFWFFVPVLAVLTLPWWPGVWHARQAEDTAPASGRMVRVLLWVWLVTIVAFFSIPRSKLIGYVLPALPALAGLVAQGVWSASAQPRRTRRRLRATAALAAIVCLAGVTGARLYGHGSSKPLARALLEQGARADSVIFVEGYFFDVPLYAGLREPVPVVEEWQAFDIDSRDNWRKELFEAGHFALVKSRRVLVAREDLPRLICERPVSWVLASRNAPARYPFLAAAPMIATTPANALWRVRCNDVKRAGTPNGTPHT